MPTWTHASFQGPVPVLVTGVSPLPAQDLESAYRRNCDGQTLSLAKSVNYCSHFCLRRDSRDGNALVTVIMALCTSFSYYYYYYYTLYYSLLCFQTQMSLPLWSNSGHTKNYFT